MQGQKTVFAKDTLINAEAGKEYLFATELKRSIGEPSDESIGVSVTIKKDDKTSTYSNYLRTIHYDHIPDICYNLTDHVSLINEEIKTAGKQSGISPAQAIKCRRLCSRWATPLSCLAKNDITPSNLAQFDAVFAGIRAYNLYSWLPAKYDILMNYIKAGGNYIVQYNQQDVVTPTIGPYPFTIGRTRVTDETADVHILLPDAAVLNYPNKIGQADFKNWMQERSIYQAQNFDSHYTAPFGMHDPNEPESNGSLIMTPYGKGNFVYTGLFSSASCRRVFPALTAYWQT